MISVFSSSAHAELILAENGGSKYTIVISTDASPPVRYAAEELQRFLGEISNVNITVRTDSEPVGSSEILVGLSSRPAVLNIDFSGFGTEGYTIRTEGKHLIIAGGEPRGTLYGVYGLLEDHLGCRWFTPAISRIPKRNPLIIADIDETKIPRLEYREPFVKDCQDGDWCARNRMNSSAASLTKKHGGKIRFGRGMFVHTFNRLLPPEKYFDEHPEYYSEIDGERLRDRSQLCTTNEDVFRICTEEMRKRILKDPEATVFSLSQNDWENFCECGPCSRMAEAEGSQMGPLLYLVNRVAEALEKEFPDKVIETLAYQYSRKPPKTMRPKPNVIIRLCSIECCFFHPLAECDSEENRAFMNDLRGWSKVSNRLWVWDYTTSFGRFLTPFPNLRVRDDNIRLFIENNVTGIFEQDVYSTPNSEFAGLSGYLGAKFLWNPGYDEDLAINEYLDAVYGKAAKPLREYLDLLHDKVENENIHDDIWVRPEGAEYLTDDVIVPAELLFDKAESLVEHDPDKLLRVRMARLSLTFVQLDRIRDDYHRFWKFDHENFELVPNDAPEMRELENRVRNFFKTARLGGITKMSETGLTLEGFESGYMEYLDPNERTYEPVQPVTDVEVKPGLDYQYYEGLSVDERDLNLLEEKASGSCPSPDVDLRKRDEAYGLSFNGFIRAPEDGIFVFFLETRDSARLFVADREIVPLTKKFGFIGLKEGLHPIDIEYFQGGGTSSLKILYEGPGQKMTEVVPGMYFRKREYQGIGVPE